MYTLTQIHIHVDNHVMAITDQPLADTGIREFVSLLMFMFMIVIHIYVKQRYL